MYDDAGNIDVLCSEPNISIESLNFDYIFKIKLGDRFKIDV